MLVESTPLILNVGIKSKGTKEVRILAFLYCLFCVNKYCYIISELLMTIYTVNKNGFYISAFLYDTTLARFVLKRSYADY